MDKASTHYKIINGDYKAWNKISDKIPKSIQDTNYGIWNYVFLEVWYLKALTLYAQRKNTDISSM